MKTIQKSVLIVQISYVWRLTDIVMKVNFRLQHYRLALNLWKLLHWRYLKVIKLLGKHRCRVLIHRSDISILKFLSSHLVRNVLL